MKMGKKRGDRCQLAVSPGLRDLTSVALQLAFPIGSPYAEIYSKYINLTLLQANFLKRLHNIAEVVFH